MKHKKFVELLESVQEAVDIKNGIKYPKIMYQYYPLDVKGIRKSLNISMKKFANALGVCRRTVSRWEQGVTIPRGSTRMLLRIIDEYPETRWLLFVEKRVSNPDGSITRIVIK